jgi:3-deoxy-D-manno-octulosonic-acid transferase
MYLFYSMAFTAAFVAMLPYFLYKAIRHGKYAASLKDRLGFISQSLDGNGPVIWVHAVSVGEFLAAEPLVRRMISELPGFRIVVSTTTAAGQDLARDRLRKSAGNGYPGDGGSALAPESLRLKAASSGVFYFPFDWRFSVRRALDRVRPAAVVIMETEIWPNFLDECMRRGIVTIIANGRLSERSFSRYRLGRPFIRRVLKSITMLLMQTEADSDRALMLGADTDHVTVCGNLKYDAVELPALPASRGAAVGQRSRSNSEEPTGSEDLHRILGLAASQRLVVAGSTAAGEEDILLEAFETVIRTPGLEDARLLLAPRRPERFDEVAKAIARSDAALQGGWVRRSRIASGKIGDHTDSDLDPVRIILLDSIGELTGIYRFASVVFVGGSLVPRGGHNIIEPAAFGKPIVVGPHTSNFTQAVKGFADAGALVQIASSDRGAQVQALSAEMIRLLSDSAAAQSIGRRGREILELNRGATTRIVTAIKQTIAQRN